MAKKAGKMIRQQGAAQKVRMTVLRFKCTERERERKRRKHSVTKRRTITYPVRITVPEGRVVP